MGLIYQFINWVLHKLCATQGCTQQVSRLVSTDVEVIVGDEERLYVQNERFCNVCRQQQLNEMSLEEAIKATVSKYPQPVFFGDNQIGCMDRDKKIHIF